MSSQESSQLWKEYRIRRLHLAHDQNRGNQRNDPYMRFIPQFKATLRADGKIKTWSAQCFQVPLHLHHSFVSKKTKRV